jgi:uncharacterized protein YyaL (SSP411 family)
MSSFSNHLIHEKSPYLKQHAHNPVDWYPWGQEAFDLAQSQDKPVFLSIGYSTCHWCHVMERESFEDPEIAKLMNETFVCVKVDREELPHVDSLYMEFAQALMASAGGWPLNVILTPELKPFFAVTYLPSKTRQGLIGLDQFIIQIKQLWESDERMMLIEQANQLVDTFTRVIHVAGEEMPQEEHILDSVEILFELSDPVYGGMKGEPKFPMGYQLEFLLQFAKSKSDSRALFYIELTLQMMYRGGIYDHLGGGFSRYTVDEKWTIPHFEKMLYDNAILAKTYMEAWKFYKKPLFRQISEETLRYLMRELAGPEGGFYSGQDADSDGHEGLYYTWTQNEITQILAPDDSDLFCEFYAVSPQGNFEGRNVLNVSVSLEEFAEAKKIPVSELSSRLEKAKELLLQEREKRKAPFKDQKVVCSWNGLMIDLLARAGSTFKNKEYTSLALKTAEFIRTHLWRDGRLLRRFCDGESKFIGGLEDYAFLIKGLITLFDEGFGTSWLNWAMELTEILTSHLKAPKGAFYQTEEEVLVRKCDFYDGAEPSGNGVHAENLIRLYQITHEDHYLSQAEDIFKAAKNYIEAYPPGACYHLMALQRYLDPKAPTLVIALDPNHSLEKEIQEKLSQQFCPHLETIWKKEKAIETLLPDETEKTPIDGKTAVYICRQNACEPALISQEEILHAIESL